MPENNHDDQNTEQHDIYDDEIFEKEDPTKKKKGPVYYAINVVLFGAILAVVVLLGYNFYSYFNIRNDSERKLEEAITEYDEVTCNSDTGTVNASYTPNALNKDDYAANSIMGYIEIPEVDMQRPIAVGDSSDNHELALAEGSAWDPYSALPQTGSYTVLAGHRDYVFQPLKDVEKGDGIVLNIDNQVYTYEVVDMKTIEANETGEVFFDENDERYSKNMLVMYTCYPFYYWAPITQRYVVYAEPVESIEYENCATTTE